MSISFMAKFNEREGNSCHIHFSLADADGPLFARDQAMFDSFLAGQLACLRELTLLLAPNINSYKRFAAGVVRADGGRLGARQPHLRAARRRPRRRRCASRTAPAAPTSTRTWRWRRSSPPGCTASSRGSSWSRRSRATPTWRPTSRGCRRRCARRASCSRAARSRASAFGEEVVAHYVNAADVELAAFDAAVTDWERVRGFERL